MTYPGLRPATLLKKRLAQAFSCEFYEISKNTFSYRIPPVAAFENIFQVFVTHLYFSKKHVEVAMSDFTMHLITLKWLR